MIEKDSLGGYIIKIASHSPSHPWWGITDQIAEGLNGYREEPGPVSSVAVSTARFGLGSLENPKTVGEVRSGKAQAIGFLVGQVMKESKGKANPKLINEILSKKLSK